MAYTPEPLFPGDLSDTALRLAASLASSARGFRSKAVSVQGSAEWRQMLELGWQGVWLAEADGGFGGNLADLAAIVEALGRHAIVTPLIGRAGVVPAVLGPFAGQSTVRECLEAHAAGGASICPVLATSGDLPGSGTAPRLQGLQLSGLLSGVDLTEPATHFVFAALGSDGQNRIVLTEAAPLLAHSRHFSGNDGRRCADLDLGGLTVPEGSVIATGPAAQQALATGQAAGALLACVEAVGGAAGLLVHTIDYLNTRVQFGVALSSFQALRHRVVEMYVAYENAYGMVRQMVLAHGQTPLSLEQVFTTKLYLASVSRMLGEAAIQLHGGMGMTTEMLASRLAVRAISGPLDFGDRAQCLDWLTAHTLAETA